MNIYRIIATTSLLLIACTACDECSDDITIDDQGRSWVQDATWSTPAQAFDAEGMKAAVLEGIFEPAADPVESDLVECWRYGSPGDYGHSCVLHTDCYDLSTIPVEEIWGASGSCSSAPYGEWDYAVQAEFGCYGVFEELGLAVALKG